MVFRGFQLVRNLAKHIPRQGCQQLITRNYTRLICPAGSNLLHNNTRHFPQPAGISNILSVRKYATIDVADMQERALDVLRNFDKVDPTLVSLEAHMINDIGLDSLDVVEIIMAFEDEFAIEISDIEAETIFTVQQSIDLIVSKLEEKDAY